MQLHFLKGYIQNIYLVEYDHGLLLLDGCCRADVITVLDYIRTTLKRPESDLKLVVVTHMHPDHAGGAHVLRRKTGCQIATGASAKPWYQGFRGRVMHITDILLTWYVAKRQGKKLKLLWYAPILKPDVVLKEGNALPGFEEWKVLETHGHTSSDISLWHRPTHRIYVADLMVKVRQKFITPWPIFHPNRYRDSVAKIRDLKPDWILLAHGGELDTREGHACFDVHTPQQPRTHWRATKYRFKRLIQRTP
jgi:glyoxylase-like metal-dependent hydrolase (beta-lactamase superfamily II)